MLFPYQADIRYHRLQLEPGYEASTCDCMICSSLWISGPFVAKTRDLAS